jgi:copper oxidase (laccase) domain-containing protein
MTDTPGRLLAWIGPCIGQRAYEVGDDVRDQLLKADQDCGDAIKSSESIPGKWHVGLGALISRRLDRLGVSWVGTSALCTFENPDRYFSYRRSPTCGRMGSFIWISNE